MTYSLPTEPPEPEIPDLFIDLAIDELEVEFRDRAKLEEFLFFYCMSAIEERARNIIRREEETAEEERALRLEDYE